MRRPLLLAIAFLLIFSSAASGQAPHEEWRTVETQNYRIHYPAPFEEWAVNAASRMEAIHERVADVVGYAPVDRVDVLIVDPMAAANGSAWPFLGMPRMILWTNPPGPMSVIGNYDDWVELLTVHEITHLAHLLRPSRNRFRNLAGRILPIGPITTAPRWVSEGYATVIEGELTGTGRPNSDFRAAVLRRWAQMGRLPSYSQLASDRRSWMGMSMAYLVGSAYLEWLQDRTGPDSLRHLWSRMSARQVRSFDEAFRGVFGDSPAALYGRFTAEITQRAMNLEEELAGSFREGELWQDLTRTTEAPHVSPDGERLVTVIRRRDLPSRMVVWATAEDEEAERRAAERVATMLERDPEDIAPVDSRPLPREPLHQLITRDRAEPFTPRWTPDGNAVIYVRFEPDRDGFLHPDLFRWEPASGNVTRLTHQADLRDSDAAPGGREIVAVHNRYGRSQLVVLDLESGTTRALTPASITDVWATPRWSPDGSRIAAIKHERGRWRLLIVDPQSGTQSEIETPSGSIVADPDWLDDDRLVAAIGQHGFVELHEITVADGSLRQITRSRGASLSPAAARTTDEIYFLSIDADGLDIRRIAAAEPPEPLPPLPANGRFAMVTREEQLVPRESFAAAPLPPSRPYGLGRQEMMIASGGSFAPASNNLELGLRIGDVVGRINTLLVGAVGGEGNESGAAVSTVWRGVRWSPRIHLFTSEHDLAEQGLLADTAEAGGLLESGRRGVQLSASWPLQGRARRTEFQGGVVAQQVSLDSIGERIDSTSLFARFTHRRTPSIGRLRFHYGLDARGDLGRSDGDDWQRLGGVISTGAAMGSNGVSLRYGRHTAGGSPGEVDRLLLGGVPSSIVPDGAVSSRMLNPALPIGTLRGDDYELQRVTVNTAMLPLALYLERHRMWGGGDPARPWLRVAGAELDLRMEPLPILGLPAFDALLGVARLLDAPFENETTWWLNLRWRP
jgi:hypothetical protein